MISEQFRVYLIDENFLPLFQLENYLLLDMTRRQNDSGALTIRLPVSYSKALLNIGVLESLQAALSMPRFFIVVYHRLTGGGRWCLWEEGVFLIDQPARVLEENGNSFVQLEAIDQMTFLDYRSVFADETEQYATRNGLADDVMHQVFNDHFGDAQGIDGRRNWIATGTVADGLNGHCGYSPYEPRLGFKSTLLTIMREAAAASDANDLPIFFDLVPTLTPTALGVKASLPLVFNTYCGHRGKDKTVNNTVGNKPVILSTLNGTITSFTIGPDFRTDYSVAMATGSGTGVRPRSIRRDNTRIDSSPRWGWKESLTVDREAADQQATDAAADEYLAAGKSRGQFIVEVGDSLAAKYGMDDCGGDYRMGDCVTVCDDKTAINARIVSINVRISEFKISKRVKLEITDEQPT